MATKNNPGKFDCYANAAPDEPLFILRATDNLAPWIVRIWASAREKNWTQLISAVYGLTVTARLKPTHNQEKINEALNCADEMSKFSTS